MVIGYVQFIVTTFLLFILVLCAYVNNIKEKLWDWTEIYEILFPHDKFSQKLCKPHDSVRWCAEKFGYDVEEHVVKTDDGYLLHVERISKKDQKKKLKVRGPPIILQHGLFQSSGIFVVANKKSSLAFYLVDQGYDVWLGNNRCVYEKHQEMTGKDIAYWNWCLDELGRFDFPAIVKFVAKTTRQKVVFCGHSQGNAQAFVGLATHPELAEHIRLFVAMAPAYFVNDFGHWSLRYLATIPDKYYWMLFGTKSFIPIMHLCQTYFPARVFCSFAYSMFAYLFGWTSDRWKKGRKPAIFMTTPRPISTKLIQHWLRISKFGKLSGYNASEDYPLGNIRCPVAVFWGKGDSLVDGFKLVESLKNDGVNLVYSKGIDDYEHMDILWAEDALSNVFEPFVGLLSDIKSGLKPVVAKLSTQDVLSLV
jgi:pimeloyl-ACP methyl ester carboxylesterase